MTVNENSKPLLTVKGLKQYFKVSNNYTVHAVENVSFQIYPVRHMVWSGNPVPENQRSEEVS